eukprot:1121033-Pelagomonas_calceolata.AAC.2
MHFPHPAMQIPYPTMHIPHPAMHSPHPAMHFPYPAMHFSHPAMHFPHPAMHFPHPDLNFLQGAILGREGLGWLGPPEGVPTTLQPPYGPEWDYVAVAEPDTKPEAEGERAHACTCVQQQQQLTTNNANYMVWQLMLAQGAACSWGRLSLKWLWLRGREEKMGQHAAQGGVRGVKHGFTGVEDNTK